jgi:hypothetical protein
LNVFTTTSAALGTSRVEREGRQSEAGNLRVGDGRWFRINTWKERSDDDNNGNKNIIIIIIIIIIQYTQSEKLQLIEQI